MSPDGSDPVARDDRLRTLWREGRAAWPAFALGEPAFVAWGRAVVADVPTPSLNAGDLYLVAACVLDVPGAARAFIDGPLASVEPSVARLLPDPVARAELMQELAVHLLVPVSDAGPRLGLYDGRAPLKAWLRVTAVRRAMNTFRGKTKLVSFDAIYDKAAEHDPELSMLRRMYRDDIAAIFAEAIAHMPDADRALLRLHYVQGSTLAELAVIQRTSRSSVQRQLGAIRDAVFERIQKLVRERLKLSDSQQGSMLRIFGSDMRAALARLLR